VGSVNLRATLDTGNFFLVGEKPEEAAENIKEYVYHVHFKDFRRSLSERGYKGLNDVYYEGCVIGQGDVELGKIVEILKEAGYKGYLAIEYEGPDPQIEGLIKSIEYVKKLLGR
jgi:sugar phosphate isomerase/epimerase